MHHIRPAAFLVLLAAPVSLAQVLGECAGTYVGTWHNETFNTTGPVTATVTVGNIMVWIEFDAGGGVFGGGDPPAVSISGPDISQTWTGQGSGLPVYGDLTATVSALGLVTVSGSNVPSPFVSAYAATGTLTACNLHLNGQISLFPTGTATTTIDANRFCYPNCDRSTAPPVLNVLDFNCFINAFVAGSTYANCDRSTAPPVLNVLDFNCFVNAFVAGCP